MNFHARGERLDSAQHQPALERRENRSRCFLQEGQLFGLLRLGANNDAAQSIAVAVQEFRGRVDHHVRTQRDGLLEIGRHEGVVNYDFHFSAVANVADGGNVAQSHQRIRRRLDIHQPRVLANRALDVPGLRGVDVGELDSESR